MDQFFEYKFVENLYNNILFHKNSIIIYLLKWIGKTSLTHDSWNCFMIVHVMHEYDQWFLIKLHFQNLLSNMNYVIRGKKI